MYNFGYDLRSSSIKVAIIEQQTGQTVKILTHPDTEMPIYAHREDG